MSKGSLFFGNASGKLGQVVLSTLKGQQIARAYQPKVANPKTTLQTDQRAIFANAVKFYKHSQQNLFKFAYEDKKKKESDYNAFMRHNVEAAMLVNRTSYNNSFYPALGNRWMLSYGSLISPVVAQQDSDPAFELPLTGTAAASLTIAQVSTALINSYSLAEGDIVTFVATIAYNISDISSEGNQPVIWGICQFIVSTSDSTVLETYLNEQLKNSGMELQFYEPQGKSPLLTITADELSNDCKGFAVIFSRKVGNDLKCSTSYLYNNDIASDIYQASLQTAYRTAALNSWGRQTEAVLEGSIAKSE